ncbi:class I SAM-dependent methyltransferase, partial [Acinetobacter baumannii]
KLDLKPMDHLVEIGSGWGGFAIYAAQHYGCRVTTITISQAQYDEAITRVNEAGLSHRIDVQLKDYRMLEGKFDKLVSIEMVEAVGAQYLSTYFDQCKALLK